MTPGRVCPPSPGPIAPTAIRATARSASPARCREHIKLGVPLPGQRLFFGDKEYEAGYEAALARLAKLGCDIVEIDIEPFYETARLLYEGPWLAERTIVAQKLLASDPDAIHPVTREITVGGLRPTAIDAFAAFYKLERLRRVSDYIFAHQVDALAMPTAPTTYTVKQLLNDPIQLNSRLGTYTNFVNLLDLCGLALPASMTGKGLPFGITFLAPGGQDARLAEIGRVFHADTQLPLGALKLPQPPMAVDAGRRCRWRDRGGRGRRASVRPAAQWRIARPRRALCWKRRKLRRITNSMRSTARCRRSPACCASTAAPARRSTWKSGRCRRPRSALSSTASLRRCRSAP